jgi:hypothetical protein
MSDLDALRAKAREHQQHLDRNTVYLDVQQLAKRWGVSPTTVRAIPALLLPYMHNGNGLQREHRRYHPDDVTTYEAKSRRKAG